MADTLQNSTSPQGDISTDLTDSLLHKNTKRVVVGIICGLASGFVLLGISTLFTADPASSKLWWLQLMGSSVFGGNAFAYDAPAQVMAVGLAIHLAVSALCGLIVGKMTTSKSVPRMAIYGLVLGGLCWLASNMFAPDLFDIQVLGTVGQWVRVALFIPFGILIGVFLALITSALNI